MAVITACAKAQWWRKADMVGKMNRNKACVVGARSMVCVHVLCASQMTS